MMLRRAKVATGARYLRQSFNNFLEIQEHTAADWWRGAGFVHAMRDGMTRISGAARGCWLSLTGPHKETLYHGTS